MKRRITKTLKDYLEENGREKQLELIGDIANKVSYSSGKPIELKCNCCNNRWPMSPNKIICKKAGDYNYYTNKKEKDVFCLFCNGTRVSKFYNLAITREDIKKMYDETKNHKRLEELSPNSHENIYIKCKNVNCNYEDVIVPHKTKNVKCPKCNMKTIQDVENEIKMKFDTKRNFKKANEISYASSDKMWWICPNGHNSFVRVSNITMLKRGCSYCKSERKTSYIEQAIYFYLKKIEDNIINNQIDEKSGESIDILLPEKRVAIEYNSQYRHIDRTDNDIAKIKKLATYYKVYVIAEERSAKELSVLNKESLIRIINVPIWKNNKDVKEEYNLAIMGLIRELYPKLKIIPNINIENDALRIFEQYKKNDIGQKSLEAQNPEVAKLWHPYKNGALSPKMFPATECQTKFYWECPECESPYQRTISNQLKVKNHICKKCYYKKEGLPLLRDEYPEVIGYWPQEMNKKSLDEIRLGSEYEAILMTKYGRLCTVKICNLVNAIKNKDFEMDIYLDKMIMREDKKKS